MSRFPLSRGIFAGNLNVVRGAEVLTQWRVGEVRSSILVSTVHRKNLVETAPQTNGKKGEASFGRLLLHKSENRFPQWLLPCLVRLGSTPIQALCSSSISAQFQTLCPFKISITLKLPVENSDSRRIESKILPPTQLSSSSQSYDF